jgi:hypothetical protein
MPSRLLRALLTLSAFMAAWCVVRPALAAGAESSRAPTASFVLAEAAVSRGLEASLRAPAPEPVLPFGRAPLCDPRGATTFAPPPQMQDAEVTLDTGLTAEDCLRGQGDERAHRVAPGRAPLPSAAASSSTDAAVISAVPRLVASGHARSPAPIASLARGPCGIPSTIDRPPRA